MTLGWRVRLLGRALAAATGPVAAMSPAKRQALRRQAAPRRLREYLNGKAALGVTRADALVPTPDGDLAVRIYRPATVASGPGLPVVVAFHGGGWVFGDLGTAEWLFSEVAARVQALVVAVNYRLAPEHQAPAAHRDALRATAWAAEHAAELGGRADRLAVLGESSGATLAAAASLAARDSGGPRIVCQALLYPITDLTLSSPSVAELPDQPILRSADLRAYVDLYLGPDGDPTDPYLSPLLARDHCGLPPALILTADHDPLRDDGRRYAGRLTRSGVPVQHIEYADSPHGFFSFPNICPAATLALDALTDNLRRALWLSEEDETQLIRTSSGPPDNARTCNHA
jgi:acetyl esterase